MHSVWPFLCACGVAIAGFLNVQGTLENYIDEHFRKPDIVYRQEDDVEYFIPDVKLKDGKLTLYPQLIIQEDDTIIRMISLEGVYSNNYLQYKDDIAGFQIAEGSWGNVGKIASDVKTELENQGKYTEAHMVILMQLEYKNYKSRDKKYKTIYYVVQDKKVEKTSELDILDYYTDTVYYACTMPFR